MHRLLRGAALPVDGRAGTASGHPAASTALRPTLKVCSPTCDDAAPDHVVDERGVEPGALDERPQHVGGQVDRVDVRTVHRRAARRAYGGFDDHGIAHQDGRQVPPVLELLQALRATCSAIRSCSPRDAGRP